MIPVRNYAMELCKDFMGILIFLSLTTLCSFKGLYDIKSFKISTACDIWFSRYRHLNLMIHADFSLVLVFIIFLWAVYMKRFSSLSIWIWKGRKIYFALVQNTVWRLYIPYVSMITVTLHHEHSSWPMLHYCCGQHFLLVLVHSNWAPSQYKDRLISVWRFLC